MESLRSRTSRLVKVAVHHHVRHVEAEHNAQEPGNCQQRQNAGQNHHLQHAAVRQSHERQQVEAVESDDEVLCHRAKVEGVTQQKRHDVLGGKKREKEELNHV